MTGPDLFDLLLKTQGAEELGRNYVFVRLARMNVAGHIDYSETSRILQQIRRRADWVPVWMAASERHQELAEKALEMGSEASAGDGFLRAALDAHWASLFAMGNEKREAHMQSVDLYRRGAPYFEPSSERVEIPHDGDSLPGYLRLPRDIERPPVIVMIGGADTNKEELHHWGTQFTRRGMAVLAFDGPGQGEHSARYGRLTMRFNDFHRAVGSVIDHLAGRAEVNSEHLGIFGNSLGGYLALDAALHDGRVGAVICNGGFFDARTLDEWPDPVIKAFSSCLGIEDPNEVRKQVRDGLDLGSVAADEAPPALIVHGGREDLSDEGELRDAARHMKGTLLVVEDGWHTCTNRDHLVSPVFGDWMRRALSGQGTRGFHEIHCTDERGYGAVVA